MVLDALDLMHEKKVSSVAIVETTQTGSTKLTGNISMTDMKEIFASCGAWKKVKKWRKFPYHSPHLSNRIFLFLLQLYDQCQIFFNSIRLQQGIENAGSDRMPSFLIHPNTTLIQAMEKMAATRSHRLWVVDSGERLVGIVSLSDCMPFIAFD